MSWRHSHVMDSITDGLRPGNALLQVLDDQADASVDFDKMTRLRIAPAILAAAAVASVAIWSGVDVDTAAAQVRQNNGVSEKNKFAIKNAYNERDRRMFEARMGGIYESSTVRRYINRIGTRLARAWGEFGDYFVADYKFEFAAVDNPRVGAYVLPSGHVYVTRGLLTVANAEDEVAAAMAHEMAHVLADHAGKRRAQGEKLRDRDVLHDFNHMQELEADRLSVEVLVQAGYDPAAQIRMLRAVSADGEFHAVQADAAGRETRARPDTHPEISARVSMLESIVGAVGEQAVPDARQHERHLDVVDGLVYGELPKYGIIRGRTFYDAGWRYTFTVPPGFSLYAGASYVQAVGPDGASIRIERRRTRRRGRIDIETYLRRYAAGGMKLQDIEAFHLSGMSAAMGHVNVDTRSGPADMRVIAIRFSSRTVFRMRMLTPHALTQSLNEELVNTVSTFRRLSRDEAKLLKPYKVGVIEVEEGTSLDEIAGRMAFVDHPRERFALLNGLSPEASSLLPKGRVKIVVE